MTELHLLKKHIQEYWGLWLLAIVVLFLFPMRVGVKSDTAMYGAVAKNILLLREWWPLHLHPNYQPEFYFQPPGVIWCMALVVSWVGDFPWAYQLFSRLCAVGTYILASLTILRSTRVSKTENPNALTVFLVLLPTWGTWVKYSSEGQMEGPLGFAIAGTVCAATYLFFPDPLKPRKGTRVLTAALFSFSFLGFLFKGLFFVPVGCAVFSWAMFQQARPKKWSSLGAGCFSLLGIAAAFGVVAAIDRASGTGWLQFYFGTQISEHVIAGNQTLFGFEKIGQHLGNVLRWYEVEFRYSPVWLAAFLPLGFWEVIKRRCRFDQPPGFQLWIYVFYMVPLWVAKLKMPHWSTPIYPICACFLTLTVGRRLAGRMGDLLTPKRVNAAAVSLLFILAVVPYPREIRYYRGQDWIERANLIKAQCSSDNPFQFIVETEGEDPWPHYVYSAFVLGWNFPARFSSAMRILEKPCRGGLLGVDTKQVPGLGTRLQDTGWVESPQQRGHFTLFSCKKPNG